MNVLYIYGKCSTCQSALRFLREKNVSVSVREITEDPPTIPELERMLSYQNGNLKKLINTSGQLYREMGLAEKMPSMRTEQILEILSKHGMLVKRPFLLLEKTGLVGFKKEQWTVVL